MPSAAFVKKTGAIARMMTAGTAWASSNRYAVIVKNSYTPNVAHTTYGDISANECDTAGYQRVQLTGQSFVSNDNPDCNDIDFTLSSTVVPVGRYVFIVEGVAPTPNAGDIITGYWDAANGASTDLNFDAVTAVNSTGIINVI